MSFSKGFARQPRSWIIAEMVVLLAVIAVLDLNTSYRIGCCPFMPCPFLFYRGFAVRDWESLLHFSLPRCGGG